MARTYPRVFGCASSLNRRRADLRVGHEASRSDGGRLALLVVEMFT